MAPDPLADNTAVLAMIRVLIRDWAAGDHRDEPDPALFYLVAQWDKWMTQGTEMPSQWTAPTCWPEYRPLKTMLNLKPVIPEQLLAAIREELGRTQVGPRSARRLLNLVSALDFWVMIQEGHLPEQWTHDRS